MATTTKTLKAMQLAAKRYEQRIRESQGLIRVSFCFDGKEFVQSHMLSEAEVALQKQYLESDGLEAFTTVTLRMAIWGAGKLGEHAVTEAFKEYARKNYTGPEQSNKETNHEDTERNTDNSDSSGHNAAPDSQHDESAISTADQRPADAEPSSGESPSSDNLPGNGTPAG